MGSKMPFWRRLVASSGSLDADDLREETDDAGTHRCQGVGPGDVAVLQGRLRHVVYTPRESLPTVHAELYDGTGSVELIWLGRRRIAGIEPGRSITVTGRIGSLNGKRAIYNPIYELRKNQ